MGRFNHPNLKMQFNQIESQIQIKTAACGPTLLDTKISHKEFNKMGKFGRP
jgi:hypothetical protein